MSWPYVAQDPSGGWYADCEGLMQDPDPGRTQIQAMEWCIDRLAGKLGQARHGCELLPYKAGVACLLHQPSFGDEDIAAMRKQMHDQQAPDYEKVLPDWTTSRIVHFYESWVTSLIAGYWLPA